MHWEGGAGAARPHRHRANAGVTIRECRVACRLPTSRVSTQLVGEPNVDRFLFEAAGHAMRGPGRDQAEDEHAQTARSERSADAQCGGGEPAGTEPALRPSGELGAVPVIPRGHPCSAWREVSDAGKGSTEEHEQQHDQEKDTAADIHFGLQGVAELPGSRSTEPIGPSARVAVCAAAYVRARGTARHCCAHPGFALLNPGYGQPGIQSTWDTRNPGSTASVGAAGIIGFCAPR
jgi:hypothetical protein